MQYQFKKWVSTSEMAEVMKVIKYFELKNGKINGQALELNPELKDYFEPVED